MDELVLFALRKYGLVNLDPADIERKRHELEAIVDGIIMDPHDERIAQQLKTIPGAEAEQAPKETKQLPPEQVANSSLDSLDPAFKSMLDSFMQRLREEHVPMKVVEARRSPERQTYLAGKNKPGATLTNAGAWQSPHQYGLAVDMVVDLAALPEDQRKWFSSPTDTSSPEAQKYWAKFGELAKASGLEWGGGWKSFKDYGHVEMPNFREYVKKKYGRTPNEIAQQGGLNMQPVASLRQPPLSKIALQIAIQPYQLLVEKAMERLGDSYFTGTDSNGKPVAVKNVVLEQGDPGHYGMVRSDKPDTIFIAFDKIKKAVDDAAGGAANPDDLVRSVIEVLAHEMGHLKANFEGGEGPAETEAHTQLGRIPPPARPPNAGPGTPPTLTYASREDWFISQLLKSADELEAAGLKSEAKLVDDLITKSGFVSAVLSPQDLSKSILRLIYHFAQKVKPENQNSYIDSMKARLATLNLGELSSKKRNPGAGVGATLSIIKNLMGGATPDTIQQTMQLVFNGIDYLK